MLHLIVVSPIRKEKKRKRNINNDLAVLPSHDSLGGGIGISIIVLLFFPTSLNFLRLSEVR